MSNEYEDFIHIVQQGSVDVEKKGGEIEFRTT
jgi:hypothetical protein